MVSLVEMKKYQTMVMCVNAIKGAIAKDYEYQHNERKKKDGSEDWSAAAAYFSELTGHKIDMWDMVHLYQNGAIAVD